MDRSPSVLFSFGLKIRRAIPADADRLADLAARTFHDSFAADNDPEAMAAHMARSYAPAIQRAEISDPAVHVLLVESDRERGRGQADRVYAVAIPPSAKTNPRVCDRAESLRDLAVLRRSPLDRPRHRTANDERGD